MNSAVNNDNFNPIEHYAYLFFCFFAFIRPISLIDTGVPFFLHIFSIIFGYLFLILILILARKLSVNRTQILILVYVFFCTASFAWGTKYKDFAIVILPIIFYFFTTIYITDKKKIESFYFCYSIGFIIPLFLSAAFIILGLNIQLVEYLSAVPRHAGIYTGAHVLAYQMSFFAFFFSFNCFISDKQIKGIKLLYFIMLIVSIYCLYQSHTRTAYIGFVLFWGIFLFGLNKKLFLIFLTFILLVLLIFSPQISNIFFKKEGKADIDIITSGRNKIWVEYINAYKESSITEKIIGKGIGWTFPRYDFHNDWLRLLIQTGLVGLFLYFAIIVSIMYDIYLCHNVKIKYYFGAILISSVIIMFGSNNIISYFELSLLFWVFMGFFYNLRGYSQ